MIKIHKAEGSPHHDDMTASKITVNGSRAGELVSNYANIDCTDWYSKRSQRVVDITAEIWIGDDTLTKTIYVYQANRNGHLHPTGTTSRQARTHLIRWVREHLTA